MTNNIEYNKYPIKYKVVNIYLKRIEIINLSQS